MQIIKEIEKEYLRESVPEFAIGDTVDVHVRIREGEKERVQIFNGTVIRRRGSGVRESFTVRRIVQGEGVERIFPLHSPNVVDVVVKKRGRVRRAKLYYLRKRVGKGTRVREKLWVKPSKKKAEPEPAEATDEAAPTDEELDLDGDHAPEPAGPSAAETKQAKQADKKKADAERKARKKAKKAKRREAKKKRKEPAAEAPPEGGGE